MDRHEEKHLNQIHPPPPNTNIEFDPAKYAHHVSGLDLTPEQRDELIRAIANIMLAFVDLGFGITSSQTACGQGDILGNLLPQTAADLLDFTHSKTAETQALTGKFTRAEQEES